MKFKLIITVILSFSHAVSFACELCKKRQPKGFENITHGSGPETIWDYGIFYGSIGIVILTIILFVIYCFKPNKKSLYFFDNQIFTL